MATADLIYRIFLFTTGNRIQHRHKTGNSTFCQDDLDIVVVFLRRDERHKDEAKWAKKPMIVVERIEPEENVLIQLSLF